MFIDPPEFITQPGKMYNRDVDGDGLPDVEAWPDKNGRIVLRVKYRGDTIQWYTTGRVSDAGRLTRAPPRRPLTPLHRRFYR